jgi:ATP-dependent RNA helicase DeaD
MTRATLRESLLADDFDDVRAVVESLTDEFDLMEVALAAVKLAHEASGAAGDDEEEIPEITPRPSHDGGSRARVSGRDDRRGRGPSVGKTRIFVGAGRIGGIRPQDLVGAITGTSSLNGRDIGAIQIGDRFSLVEVPDSEADQVIAALRRTTLKGQKPTIRRERATAR